MKEKLAESQEVLDDKLTGTLNHHVGYTKTRVSHQYRSSRELLTSSHKRDLPATESL